MNVTSHSISKLSFELPSFGGVGGGTSYFRMMKKNTFLFSTFALGLAWYALSSSTLRDPKNPPTGSTGAPSENTCAKATCHSTLGAQVGTVAMSGVPDTVVANTTYTVNFKVSSTSATSKRSGFQMTCLDGKNVKCGTFTANTAVSVGTANNREYPRQAQPVNFAAGVVQWSFPWKAPAAVDNDTMRFYYIGMCCDGNGKEGGDKTFKGFKKVYFKKAVASKDLEKELSLQIYPNPAHETLFVTMKEARQGNVLIYSLDGRVVEKTNLTDTQTRVNIGHLVKGAYIATIDIDGQRVSKKIVIE